jgi:hypothetical protein
MMQWLKRIGRAVGMGLAWAIVWAPIAVLIGTQLIDPDNSMDEMWVAIGAYPGFLCGVIFSAALMIAERGRRLDELALSRVAAWGALAGLLVGVFPFTVGTSTTALPLWQLVLAVIGSFTLLSALSAVASAAVARKANGRDSRDTGARVRMA